MDTFSEMVVVLKPFAQFAQLEKVQFPSFCFDEETTKKKKENSQIFPQ